MRWLKLFENFFSEVNESINDSRFFKQVTRDSLKNGQRAEFLTEREVNYIIAELNKLLTRKKDLRIILKAEINPENPEKIEFDTGNVKRNKDIFLRRVLRKPVPKFTIQTNYTFLQAEKEQILNTSKNNERRLYFEYQFNNEIIHKKFRLENTFEVVKDDGDWYGVYVTTELKVDHGVWGLSDTWVNVGGKSYLCDDVIGLVKLLEAISSDIELALECDYLYPSD